MTLPIKYIFFDVANTLLHKPDLLNTIIAVCNDFAIHIDHQTLAERHKLVSELIPFPALTNRIFYNTFNAEVLLSLGVIPDTRLLDEIFSKCSYLPWKPFGDTDILNRITLPLGIISNWDTTLVNKLSDFFSVSFCNITVSAEQGCAKPDPAFYRSALDALACKPEEIFYVGDSIKLDMVPAQSLGIQTALLDRDQLYPDYQNLRIKSLYELSNHIPELHTSLHKS